MSAPQSLGFDPCYGEMKSSVMLRIVYFSEIGWFSFSGLVAGERWWWSLKRFLSESGPAIPGLILLSARGDASAC